VTVVLAVIVGEVMGDGAVVAGRVVGMSIRSHGGHSGRRSAVVPSGIDSP
jgi:hypothetical protein